MTEEIFTIIEQEFIQSIDNFTLRFNKSKIEQSYIKNKEDELSRIKYYKLTFFLFSFLYTARRIEVLLTLWFSVNPMETDWTTEVILSALWAGSFIFEIIFFNVKSLSFLKGGAVTAYLFNAILYASFVYYKDTTSLSPL